MLDPVLAPKIVICCCFASAVVLFNDFRECFFPNDCLAHAVPPIVRCPSRTNQTAIPHRYVRTRIRMLPRTDCWRPETPSTGNMSCKVGLPRSEERRVGK